MKISDIKKLVNILLNELNKQNDSDTVELENDLYWNILDDEMYNPYKEPMDHTLGSLIEDWEFLQKVLKEERKIIDYDLYKLASVLKFLGKKKVITKE